MTWPLTFSSPPSVEFHRRKAAPGILEAGVRAKAARGSYCESKSVTLIATRDCNFFLGEGHTAREMREESIVCEIK